MNPELSAFPPALALSDADKSMSGGVGGALEALLLLAAEPMSVTDLAQAVGVPAGEGITAIGVWEIVYWVGGRPDYQWQYVNAGTTGAVAAGGGTLYCSYP